MCLSTYLDYKTRYLHIVKYIYYAHLPVVLVRAFEEQDARCPSLLPHQQTILLTCRRFSAARRSSKLELGLPDDLVDRSQDPTANA